MPPCAPPKCTPEYAYARAVTRDDFEHSDWSKREFGIPAGLLGGGHVL